MKEENSNSESSGCFYSNSTVLLNNGTKVKMKDLKVGDRVASIDKNGQIIFSPVIMFFHRDPTLRTKFRIIETDDHKKISITPLHLIYTLNKQTQRDNVGYANRITAGDQLYVRNPLRATRPLVTRRVVNIKEVILSGAFAPLTESGKILVDDILVSCYALFPSETISHWSMLPVRLLSKFFPSFFETDQLVHWYPRSLLKLYSTFRSFTMREV